jgi:hypothetical protein
MHQPVNGMQRSLLTGVLTCMQELAKQEAAAAAATK